MLDSFIIDQIKKIEEKQRRVEPVSITLELPMGDGRHYEPKESDEDENGERGVIVIDLM